MRETARKGWGNFQAGGGGKTVVRSLAQVAPWTVGIGGIVSTYAGLVVPGLPDLLSNATPSPILPLSIEHPEWGFVGLSVGAGVAAVTSIIRPFSIGSQIRRGEIDEIPPMENIADYTLQFARRGVGRLKHSSRRHPPEP